MPDPLATYRVIPDEPERPITDREILTPLRNALKAACTMAQDRPGSVSRRLRTWAGEDAIVMVVTRLDELCSMLENLENDQ